MPLLECFEQYVRSRADCVQFLGPLSDKVLVCDCTQPFCHSYVLVRILNELAADSQKTESSTQSNCPNTPPADCTSNMFHHTNDEFSSVLVEEEGGSESVVEHGGCSVSSVGTSWDPGGSYRDARSLEAVLKDIDFKPSLAGNLERLWLHG